MLFFKKNFYLFFIFSIFSFFDLRGQILRKPGEVINIQNIIRWENQWQNKIFTADEILPLLEKEMQNYFIQFKEERQLRENIAPIPFDYYNFPLNKIHTLIYIRNLEEIQKTNRIFSPILFRAFLLKAKLHKDLNQPNLALLSYLQALNFSIPILEIKNQNNVELPQNLNIIELENTLNNKNLLQKNSELDYWKRTFGNEDFYSEILDPQLQNSIQRFLNTYQEYQKQCLKIQEIKKNYYRADIDLSLRNQKNVFLNQFYQTWDNIKTLWEELLNIENILLSEQKNLKKQYGEILYDMAVLMKNIELQNKERERILNQSSYYRGTGNPLGINKTLYRQFSGYKKLLELANQLDPENLNYIDLLSDEYYSEKEISLGLKIEKDWFLYAKKEDERNPKHYFRIISYYINSKNFSLAKDYLVKFKESIEKNPEHKNYLFENKDLFLAPYDHFLYFYSNFFLKHYKTSESSIEKNLLDILNKVDQKLINTDNFDEMLKGNNFKYLVLIDLSTFYRLQKNIEEEKKYLEMITELYNSLKQKENEYEVTENQLKKELQRLKQKLYYEEDSESSQKLFELEKVRLPSLRNQIQSLRTLRNSMNIGKVLERLAYINYLNKNLDLSLMYWNIILENANISDNYKRRALKNQRIINKIKQTGYYENIVLPDDFER